MGKIFISGKIPQIGYDLLKEHEVEIYRGEELISEAELGEKIADVDALLCPLSTPVTRNVLETARNLKIVANFGAGFNNIDVQYAKENNIFVTNTPGVSTEATAELTLGIILALTRRIPEGDQLCRTKGFSGWAPLFFLGKELTHKTLGIIGLGNIGQAVAKRAKAFGMQIIYTGPRRKDKAIEDAYGASFVTLDELLHQSDIVSIHSPYNPSTHHLITESQLTKMKKEAFLVNVARGAVVNESDLVKALQNGTIAGAALDVFEFEPSITEELKQMQNVVLTPHIGNATIEARNAMAELAAKNILEVLNGNEPVTSVF
ncbi:2-hydroxyacid dehydrogenase family protein [Bacillus sp. FJAT-49736]|uniref:2-hydroxyacid dehydrogenase family protein n=1 Tax=Bacillus sp. FJAT-49736 TaxID=2833582 RepID=UPI001BC90F0B|nr:2-hydroxyacid dehydrogenase family protein [Bacillus sp. FJAT-49736]MBS4172665.1 2-hydroxyacid dehydrogenase family protein [Bacillus sp. FJAT-49736]